MNTKAQVHDLADLFIMMIFMFFLSFFLYGIFSSNVSSADDASLEKISSYNTETLLLHYLGRPVPVDAEEILMRDLILTAVNEDDEDLFEEKTEQFFEQNELKGRVQLSNSAGENLMSFSNTPNFRLEESEAELLNLARNQEQITVLFALEK